jgi:hypothetical protein
MKTIRVTLIRTIRLQHSQTVIQCEDDEDPRDIMRAILANDELPAICAENPGDEDEYPDLRADVVWTDLVEDHLEKFQHQGPDDYMEARDFVEISSPGLPLVDYQTPRVRLRLKQVNGVLP